MLTKLGIGKARVALGHVVVLAAIATGVVVGTSGPVVVVAAGTPNVSAPASTPDGVLFGAPITVTIDATNPAGPDGYNLSFQDVLPVGVSYVPGSSNPAPRIVVRGDGTTVLIFSNVSDLLEDATVSFTYQIAVDQVIWDANDVVNTTPRTFVQTDPRLLPRFDAIGNPIPTSYTGSDSSTTSTELLAFQITKSEPNAELELLRGLHDHQTVYTLRIDNNRVNESTDFVVVDYLPAALEFLGCGDVDNSSAEEYLGSGPINPGNAPATTSCVAPSSVTTVELDPDGPGPMPDAVYTRVEWDSATLATIAADQLAPAGFFELEYVAAIPMLENVAAPDDFVATANVDNNQGNRTYDEQPIENYAVVSGLYNSTVPNSDDDTLVVTSEDVSIHKTVDTATFSHESTSTWTFVIESGEYTRSTGPIVITDTIPDGLNFVDSTPPPTTGPTPNLDGTLTVEWVLPAFSSPSSSTSISMDTTTRFTYRETAEAVASRDSWTNVVDLQTTANNLIEDGSLVSVPVIDDSSAAQTAGGFEILKEVSAPVAGDLTCGDGTGITFDPDLAGDYRPGDGVCWRLTATFPHGLDTLDTVVQDFLPPGFVYQSWDTGAADTGAAVAATFADDDPLLTWTLATEVPDNEVFQVVVQSRLAAVTAVTDVDILSNLMKLAFRNTAGEVFQAREEADATWSRPDLGLVKGVVDVDLDAGDDTPGVPAVPADGVLVQQGQIVTYEVRVANSGGQTAFAVDVRDLLPIGIDCADVSNITLGGVCAPPTGEPAQIDWPGTLALSATPGGSIVLNYDVTVPAGVAPQTVFDNTAGVRQYVGDTNQPLDETYPFVPSNNIDPTLEDDDANSDPAIDTSSIRTGTPTLTKSVASPADGSGNNNTTQATIGEVVTYTITAALPGGTTYNDASITDTVNSRLLPVPGSTTVTVGGVASAWPVSLVGQQLTVTVPSGYTTPIGAAGQAVLVRFEATVRDVATNIRNGTIPNSASLAFDLASGTPTSVAASSPAVRIVEPNLALGKANNTGDDIVEAGETVRYTVTATNTAGTSVSRAHDVRILDTVPAQLIVLEGPGDPAEDNDVIPPNGGVWNSTLRTITWESLATPSLAFINPGSSAVVAYDVTTVDPLFAAGKIVNEADAFTSSQAGSTAGERNGLTTTVPGYQDDASDEVTAPALQVTKAGSPDIATVGETITYTLGVTIPASTVAWDVTLLDDLPNGIAFDQFVSIACVQGVGACSPNVPITGANVTSNGDVVSFFLGDLATASVAPRVVTIVYQAFVDDVIQANAGASLQNRATAYLNLTNKIVADPTTPPPTTGFDVNSNTAVDTVATVEPNLSIDKDVVGQVADTDTRRAKPGDVLTYSVRVANSSAAGTSAAHDITITDTPDGRLGSFIYVGGLPGDVTEVDGNHTDGNLEWTFTGPLAPGTSVTITYSLTIPADLDSEEEVVVGPEVVNTATIESYFGASAADRFAEPNRFREYGPASDRVDVEVDLASIGDRVWFDADGDGVQDASEPGLEGVSVTVTYLGPNGVLGGGDDESETVVTDANGNYLVDRLPGGQFLVVVDQLSLGFPAGMTPSYDLGGGTVSPNGSWTGSLLQNQDRSDVDFGFIGTGSIGDTVWFDQDLDGVQDAGEAGIAGVGLTVLWFGQDGNAGTTDDNVVYNVTTDPNGNYLVDNLPAGSYSVTVNPLTMPVGYSLVYDPQGALDGVSTLTLGAGKDNTVQDFGYAGSGSIGDTIYLDRDGDGVRDLTDPGLAGVTVTLLHLGPDGLSGTTDDSTFTTVTDADGEYGFANLPPGDYVVEVTGGLPANVRNSDDPDGPADPDAPPNSGDSTSELTLANGESNPEQDFGYDATSVLGDRVWWDINGNGTQDVGEPGLFGIEVTATGPNGISFVTTTDANGNYLFVNVPDGAWNVAITGGVPVGMVQTFDADGLGTPNQSSLTLDTENLLQDFGYRGQGSVGDTLWLDINEDGVQDLGEPGLENVTIRLTWYGSDGVSGTEDDIELTTVTNAFGFYEFVGLPAGEFLVEVDTDDEDFPSDLAPTYDRDGGTDTPNGSTLVTLELDGGVVESFDDVDFGFNGGAAVGDFIWFDIDGDGAQDPGESGLPNVGLTLTWFGIDGEPGGGDDEVFVTTTDLDGSYLFTGIPAGNFLLAVTQGDLPGNMAPTFDSDDLTDEPDGITLFTLEADQTQLQHDFGFRGLASIGDFIYYDLNGNGVHDFGEPGVPAQPVVVTWFGPDGESGTDDDVTLETVTDSDGSYLVEGLPNGTYIVEVVGGIVSLATNSGDPDGEGDSMSELELDGASNLDQDFGYVGNNSVGDRVWWDVNGNGVDDLGEPGLSAVEVTLTWLGPDGEQGGGDDLVFITTTDADGDYSFAAMPDGSFVVEVTDGLLAGRDTPTYDEDDGTVAPDGSTRIDDLGVGTGDPVDHDTADFGFAGTGSIGDLVWLDLDGDGIVDAGEPGIPGVEVTLTWAGPDGEFGTGDDFTYPVQVTSNIGGYLFEHLPAGSFSVALDGVPVGVEPSADPDGDEPDIAFVELGADDDNLDQDFGYVGDATIGDLIWLDLDGDGVPGPNEPGLPGLTVTLTSPGSDGIPGTPDDIVITTVTDANGNYLVSGLPGVPTVVTYDAAGLAPGLVPNSDLDGGDPTSTTVALTPGATVLDVDFGVVGTATLTGVVFDDLDGDGVQDPGEPGIEGVDVVVEWDGPNGPVTFVVTTDESGGWSLTDLPSGDYAAVIDGSTIPDGLVLTTPASVTVTVPPGGSASVKHGVTAGATVGDTIWYDINRNGVIDSGEPGLADITVTLLDGDGVVVATTVTNSSGVYLFAQLPPGTYTIVVDTSTLPSFWTQSFDPDGVLDARTTVTLRSGEVNLDQDFGFAEPAVLPPPPITTTTSTTTPITTPIAPPVTSPPGITPDTGGNFGSTLGIALLILVAGVGLVATARRRRTAG